MSGLEFRPMLAGDAVLIDIQPSQRYELGLFTPSLSMAEGEDLADNGLAWTAHRGTSIVTIAGFRELFPGHAYVWAVLAAGIGRDHLAVTRFAREKIAAAPYRRLEAIVDCENEAAVEWAKLVGLAPVHVLHGYGPEGKPHILFEKVTVQ